jgi:uncharacterized YccA/Bax inhibitor family protein
VRTANPALNDRTFTGIPRYEDAAHAMTLQGTVNKSGLLLVCVTLAACWTWHVFFGEPSPNPAVVTPYMTVGAIGGLIAGLVTVFKPQWAAVTAPIYAVLEGFFVGGMSSLAEAQYPGIAIQAVGLTFGTCLAMLLAYSSGLIKVSENFKLGVVAATGGIALVYFVSIILGFFGVSVPYIYGNGLIGIGFSVLVVGIAALNLVLDFDFVETGAHSGFPKYMEWYAAFGLMVTLIWLYIEILRLLMKLRSRE